ncbi:MAG: hypothetical protein KBG15_15390 [Kofleriaceae bacterium]|nr:hypothetical protein [Kofleriaceae bacterium]
MIEFNDLVNALAQWRLNNGQSASTPLVTQPEQVGGAAPAQAPPPAGRNRATAPPALRTKAASIPPPRPVIDLNEFAEVPEDAIEEDGADFEMSFGGAPPITPAVEEFAEAPDEADAAPADSDPSARRGNSEGFGDSELTMVGGPDRDGRNS